MGVGQHGGWPGVGGGIGWWEWGRLGGVGWGRG